MLNRIGKKLGYKDDGFTIIEVLIVLAVAGLIMAIVLIAIPQLQRNQRNTARREIIGRIKTELDSYTGNNNGRIPTTTGDLDAVYNRYLGCAGTAAAPTLPCDVNVEDPSEGTPVLMDLRSGMTAPSAGLAPYPQAGTPAADALGVSYYAPGFTCDGESLVGGDARNYAMWIGLEGGAIYCLDNA